MCAEPAKNNPGGVLAEVRRHRRRGPRARRLDGPDQEARGRAVVGAGAAL